MQHLGVGAKIDWPGIIIRCPSGATCLPAGCCFIELAKYGVIWHSEFRGKYLNVNVLRDTRKDGWTNAKSWKKFIWPLSSWAEK